MTWPNFPFWLEWLQFHEWMRIQSWSGHSWRKPFCWPWVVPQMPQGTFVPSFNFFFFLRGVFVQVQDRMMPGFGGLIRWAKMAGLGGIGGEQRGEKHEGRWGQEKGSWWDQDLLGCTPNPVPGLVSPSQAAQIYSTGTNSSKPIGLGAAWHWVTLQPAPPQLWPHVSHFSSENGV